MLGLLLTEEVNSVRMLRLDPSAKTLAPLERQAELRPKPFFDHYVLSEFLAHSPRALFAEAGLELLAIAAGDNPLAVDPDGRKLYLVHVGQYSSWPTALMARDRLGQTRAIVTPLVGGGR